MTRVLVDYLECGHCGRDAIVSDDNGLFTDGDGGKCAYCNFPGHVSADGETCYWNDCDAEPSDVCEDPECRSCIRPARREYSVRARAATTPVDERLLEYSQQVDEALWRGKKTT